MPFTTEISGVGSVQYTGSDYTNSALVQAFITSLSEFYQVKTGSGTLTATDVTNIQNQINFLREIARNGVSVNLDASNPGAPLPDGSSPGTSNNVVYFLTPAMAEVLNRLFSSFAPSGNLDNITLTDLNNFRNGTSAQNTSDIQNIFVFAARLMAVLPPLTPGGAQSAIATDPVQAASQMSRIYVPGKVFTASTVNESVTRSLQAFTEMEYVNTANEVINEKLLALRDALKATQGSLDNLNQLQQLHNSITVNSRTFTYNFLGRSGYPSSTMADYIAKYESYASSQLKKALVPQLTSEFLPFSLPSSEIIISARRFGGLNPPVTQHWDFRVTILNPSKYYAFNTSTNAFEPVAATYTLSNYVNSTIASTLSAMPFTKSQILQIVGDGFNGVQKFPLLGSISALNTLKLQLTRQRGSLSALLVSLAAATPASVLADPLKRSQALIGKMSAVYTDLVNNLGATLSTTSIASAQTGVRAWIMDNYQSFSSPSAANAGKLQQNLTNAITAAEATNDTQKEEVRNSLLVFEEFYKSASAVLTQLSQMIVKAAQNIAR